MMKRYFELQDRSAAGTAAPQDRGHLARFLLRPGRPRSIVGFTLVEVLFAIAILGVGIVGILTLFVSGINMAGWAGSRSQASMEAQSLYAQILSYCDNPTLPTLPKRFYIEIMRDKFYPSSGSPAAPKWAATPTSIWIHQCIMGSASDRTGNSYKNPIPISSGHDYSWQCRVTNYMMDKKDPINVDPSPAPTAADINPPGLVEVALAIYKQWKPGKEALAVYTTLLSLESK
jgi:prepilin-type N-terminal cleavage/methylation domain-containing protein